MNKPYPQPTLHSAELASIEQKINQNKLQQAALALNRLVKLFPQDARLFMLGSRLAEASGNRQGMLKAARIAHQLSPLWPQSIMRLADILATNQEAEEATKLATQAVALASEQPSLGLEILNAAATVANRLGQHAQSLVWLRQAEEIKPMDPSIRFKVGFALSALGQFTQAIEVFSRLLGDLPDNPAVLTARRQAALGAKDMALAIQDSDTLLTMDPQNEEHQYFAAIAHGQTPPTQPASLVTHLFNQLAGQFDHQVTQLAYKLPAVVAGMIKSWYPDLKADVLDLGCGTGLLGSCLGPMEGFLIGVDLSQGMIEQAMLVNVYDRFHQVNLLDALRDTPGDHYNVITVLDALNYFGRLEPVVPNALRVLMPGGHFVFSCEAGQDGDADFVLQPSGRYAHQRSYVQRLLNDAGFEHIVLGDQVLRTEAGVPVNGFLASAQKSLSASKATSQKKTDRPRSKNARPTIAGQ